MVGVIKEALQWIVESQQPKIIKNEDNGHTYTTDGNIKRLDNNLRADAIRMSTLSGLVDYIKSNVYTHESGGEGIEMLVHVVSPTEVRMISALDFDRKRECLAVAVADLPEFAYGRFIDTESFLIGIRSKFIQNEGAMAILRFAGTVENGTLANYSDDGISQSATVKKALPGKRTRSSRIR